MRNKTKNKIFASVVTIGIFLTALGFFTRSILADQTYIIKTVFSWLPIVVGTGLALMGLSLLALSIVATKSRGIR